MKLTAKQKKILWLIGDLQLFAQGYAKEENPLEISFQFEGTHVVHPMLEESGMCEVDPVEYYGKAFLDSEFVEYI